MLTRVAAVDHVARGVMQVQARLPQQLEKWGAGECQNPATLYFFC